MVLYSVASVAQSKNNDKRREINILSTDIAVLKRDMKVIVLDYHDMHVGRYPFGYWIIGYTTPAPETRHT